MRLTLDSLQPVKSLLREVRLCVDPRFHGELKPFHSDGHLRASYFRRNGRTVDEFGELLLDRGYVTESPSERDVLELLSEVFEAEQRSYGTRKSKEQDHDESAYARETERELETARKNRNRAWKCPCGKSALRSARLDLMLTCGYCGARVVRSERTIFEIMNDVSLSLIQSPSYRCSGDAASLPDEEDVPF